MAPNAPRNNEYEDPAAIWHRERSELRVPSSLPILTKFCYSVGHMLNDLCSAIWFTYVLIFLQYIVKLSSTKAGLVIMVGQLADAISTPLIGIQIDNRIMFCARNVKRKTWHLLGTICVVISFPLLFVECRNCDETSVGVYLGLLFLVIFFQFGWAATQVAHLSLIPEITSDSQERDLLSNLRYSVQEFAQILCFFIAWVIFNYIDCPKTDDRNKEIDTIGIEDASKFRNLVIVTTGIGIVFAILFQLGVDEKINFENCDESDDEQKSLITKSPREDGNEREKFSQEDMPHVAIRLQHHKLMSKNWIKWLTNPKFYQVCAVYLFSRLFNNICSAYFPLYLEESLGAPQIMIIYIPLVLNISGLATCLVLEPINKVIGKKISFAMFCCVSLCGCLIIFLDGRPDFPGYGEYGMALLMGSGSAAMVAIALSFVPDLIGSDIQNGALVYGLMSFVEKLFNGLAVLGIQYSHSIMCQDVENCGWFYRNLMLFALGAIIFTSLVCIMTLSPIRFAFQQEYLDGNMNSSIDNERQPDTENCGALKQYDGDNFQGELMVKASYGSM